MEKASIWTGQLVRLRGLEPDDWQYFKRFDESSDDARDVYRILPPASVSAHKRNAEKFSLENPTDDCFGLAIERLDNDQPIVGALSTFDADIHSGRFKYGIAIDREHRRQGYATEAVALLLTYMFRELRYNKCEAEIYAFNESSIRLHEKLGFQNEGRLRSHIYTKGAYCDVIVMGLLAEEFSLP